MLADGTFFFKLPNSLIFIMKYQLKLIFIIMKYQLKQEEQINLDVENGKHI